MDAQQQQIYREKAQAQLREWKADVDALKAKADGLRGDAKLEVQQLLAKVESKRAATEREVGRLAEQTGDAWGDVTKGLERSWTEIKSALDQAQKRFP